MPSFKFKFAPLQRVTITAYGLNCEGRVMRCMVTKSTLVSYEVEYALHAGVTVREFLEDELKETTA